MTEPAQTPVEHKGILALFASHRVAANLLMIIMILAGVWGLNKLKTQFFPDFNLDMITVRVIWNGASAEDVERAITLQLEQELRNVEYLHKLSSTSATGVASLTLEFEEDTDMAVALDGVNERVARLRNLPSSAEKPEITRVIRFERIARLALSSDEPPERLRDLAYRIRDDLLADGIARITISGLPKEEIAIEVPSENLRALDLTLDDIASRIRQASQDIPAGFIGENEVARQVRALDQQRDTLGFETLPIQTGEGVLHVEDLATVERRGLSNQVRVNIDDQPTVELLLQRTESSDALQAARILGDWLQANRQSIPPNVTLHVYDEHWIYIKDRINLLVTNGLGGLLLVVIVLFIFLNGRVAFWVTMGIPVSFMATLAILYLAGGSINMISLFGLIMAVGIIVDDAIVVAEHAQTSAMAGHRARDAAILGARRMLAPVASSSLTTVAAFLPLILVGGVIGNIMFQIPLVIICVVIASLIECFFVLPAHMRMALKHSGQQQGSRLRQKLDNGFIWFRDHLFAPLAQTAVRQRWTTLAAAVGMLIIAIGLVAGGRVGFTFFPSVESKVIYANASFTAGTNPARVEDFMRHLQHSLRATESAMGGQLVESAVVNLGSSASGGGTGQRTGDQYASLMVELGDPDERDFSNADFIRAWEQRIQPPPGIELFTLTQRQTGPSGQDVDIRLAGAQPEVLKAAAAELMDKLNTYPGVLGTEDDLPWGQEQLIFELTPTGRALGLSTDYIGRQLRAAYEGALVQIFQDRHEEVEVRALLPLQERDYLNDIQRLQIRLPGGGFTPLENVATLRAKKGFEALRHSNGELTVRVSADVDRTQNNANRILADLKQAFLPQLARQHGIHYFFEGRAADQAETMADMKLGTLLAMAFIYLILAWVFASYSKPLVIMTAIPFGFIGAVFGHYLMGVELTILSLFGIVGLSGIVVNDSIILITFYQHLRAQGMAAQQAIIEAARQRLRAVLLTSLTTIGGLTPLLFETSIQAQFLIPMAISITFGLASSTLLVLLVIPALLSILEDWVAAFHRRFGAAAAPARTN